MPILQPNNNVQVSLPAGSVLVVSGYGSVQVVAPRNPRLPLELLALTGWARAVGPFDVACTVNIVAVGQVNYFIDIPQQSLPSPGDPAYTIYVPAPSVLRELAAAGRLDLAAKYVDSVSGATFVARSPSVVELLNPTFYCNGTQVTAPADTAENTLDSVVIPGGTMGPNSVMRITAQALVTDSAGTKTFWFRLGGTNIMATIFGAGNSSATYQQLFYNRNSVSANSYQNGNTSLGPSAAAIIDTSINTAIDQTLSFVAQKSSGPDTIRKTMFMVEILG